MNQTAYYITNQGEESMKLWTVPIEQVCNIWSVKLYPLFRKWLNNNVVRCTRLCDSFISMEKQKIWKLILLADAICILNKEYFLPPSMKFIMTGSYASGICTKKYGIHELLVFVVNRTYFSLHKLKAVGDLTSLHKKIRDYLIRFIRPWHCCSLKVLII